MDTTEIYARMSDCLEIQEYAKRHTCIWADIRAYWFCKSNITWRPLTSDDFGIFVWLPTQDWLQAMMGLSNRQLMKQFRDFLVWITGTSSPRYPGGFYNRSMPYGVFLSSFEQLWLAFVMKEKYGKIWDGEQWKVQ